MRKQTPGASSNVVQFVIKASDQAGKVFQDTAGFVKEVGNVAIESQVKILALGAAIAGIGPGLLTKLAEINQVVSLIKRTMETPVVKPFIEVIGEAAEATLADIQPLAEVLSSISEGSAGFREGFFQGQDLLGNVEEQIDTIKGQMESAAADGDEKLEGFFKKQLESQQKLKQTLIADSSDIKNLEVLEAKVDKTAEKVQDALSQAATRAFNDLPIDNIPFAKQIIENLNLEEVAKQADKNLANAVVDGAIKKQIPQALEDAFAAVAGRSLAQDVSRLARSNASTANLPVFDVLPDYAQEALKGSLTGAIRAVISKTVVDGFSQGFNDVDSIVGTVSEKLGVKLAKRLMDGANPELQEAFQKFDSFFGGQIAQTAQTALGGTTGNLIQALTQNTDLGGLDKLLGGNVSAAAGELLEQKLGNALQRTGGVLVQRLTAGFNAAVPAQFQAAFNFLKSVVRKETQEKLQQALEDQVKSLIQGFMEPLTSRPVEKIQAEIDKLQAIADNSESKKLLQEADDRKAALLKGNAELIKSLDERKAKLKEAYEVENNSESAVDRWDARKNINSIIDSIEKSKSDLAKELAEIEELRKKAAEVSVAPEAQDFARKQAAAMTQQLEAAKAASAKSGDQDLFQSVLEKAALGINDQINEGIGKLADFIGGGNGAFRKRIAESLVGLDQTVFGDFFNDLLKTADTSILDIAKSFEGSLFGGLKDAFDSLDTVLESIPTDSLGSVGQTAASSFISGFTGEIYKKISPAINQIDELILSTVSNIEEIPAKLSAPLDITAGVAGYLSGVDEPTAIFSAIQQGASQATSAITAVSENLFFFSSGLEALKGLVNNGPFELLIGQNVKLKEQLLATQSTLAATNKVVMNGKEITNPKDAILGLEPAINQAVDDLRKGSLELTNVTSKDLIETFTIVAGQAGNIGINLTQAKDLTLDFGAAMGSLGLDLSQSRQEIQSILTGQIDMNSVVAKSLNLTNEQVEKWRAQNRLVEELSGRLSAFRAGNALAAQSLGGMTSNIQEVVDEIGRMAGEPLLEPILKELEAFYKYIFANKEALSASIGELVQDFFRAVQASVQIIKDVFNATKGVLVQIPFYLFESLANAVEKAAQAIRNTLEILQPAINIFAEVARSAVALSSPFITIALQAKALQFGISTISQGFGTLSQIMPGVGELMFLLSGRTSGIVNTFTSLSGILGTGGAGFLLLGKNMASIPGLAQIIASKMGPIGPVIAGFIPSIAGVGIQVAGLTKMFPPLAGVIQGATGAVPGLLDKLKDLASKSGVFGELAPSIELVSNKLKEYTGSANVGATVTEKFFGITKEAGISMAKQAASIGLLAAGTFGAFYVLDKFVLKNEQFMQVLSGLGSGLMIAKDAFLSLFTNPVTLATLAVTTLTVAIKFKLIGALRELIGTQVLVWANSAAGGFMQLATVFKNLGMLGAAQSANQLATSINALIIGATQGKDAMTAYLATQKAVTVANAQTAASTGAASFSFGTLTKKIVAASVAMVRFAVTAIASVVRSMVSVVVGLATGTITFGTIAAAAGTAAASCWAFATATLAGTGGLTTLLPTLGAGTVGFGAFAGSVGSAVVALGALLLPIVAVVGAIATIALYAKTKEMEDSTAAAEEYSRQANQLGDESLALANKLKIAKTKQQEADKAGVALSEEEYAKNKQLQDQAKAKIQAIDAQVASLKKAKDEVKGKEQQNSIQSGIDMLERQKKLLQDMSTVVQTQARDLPKLGTAFSQMSEKVAASLRALENPSGDPEIFKQKAQDLLDMTEAQLEAGAITEQEAISRYNRLANLSTLDLDTQLKAQKAITEAQKSQGEERLEDVKLQQETTQSLIESGVLSEAAGEQKLTEQKREELRIRLENLKAAKAQEDQLRADGLKADLESLDKQIADAQGPLKAAIDKGDPKAVGEATRVIQTLNEKRQLLQTQYANAQMEADRTFNNSKQQIDNETAVNEENNLKRIREEKLRDFDEQASLEQSELDRKLQTQEQYNQDSLRIARERRDEEIKQIATQRSKLDPTDTEGLEALRVKEAEAEAKFAKTERDITQKRRESKLKDFDEAQAIEQAQLDARIQTEEKFNEDSLKIAQNRFTEEMTQIEAQRKELVAGDVEGQQELAVREAQARAKLAQAEQNNLRRRQETRLKDFDEQQAEQDALYAEKLLSEQEYSEKSLDIVQRRAAEELKQIDELAKQLPAGDRQGQEALEARRNDVRKRVAEAEEKFEKEQVERKIRAFDDLQRILEGELAAGNLTEQEFNQQSLENTQQKLDAELAEVERQRVQLKSTDREGLLALEAQEADILKRRNAAQEEFWQRQIDMVKRAQQKVLDELTLSQTKRDIEFQKAINRNQLSEAEVGALRVDQTRQELEEKLNLEQQFLAQLEALPKSNDPVKREQQEAEIRQSVQKTYDITLQLAENEQAQQEAQQKLIQERIQEQIDGIQNVAEAERMASELRLQQFELEQTFMESRLRILQAQMQMQDAVNSFRSSEYSIAESLTKSERKKAKIAEEAAKAEFEAAKTRIAMKRTELALTEAQNQALIERKRIELESKKSDAKANLAEQIANREMVNADPKATAAQKYAADLKVESALNKGAQLEVEGALIDREERSQRYFDAVQRQQFELGSEAELDQAEANYVGKTRKKSDDRKLAKKSLKKARRAKNIPFVPLPEFDELDAEGIRSRYMEQFGMGGSAPQTPTLPAKQQISLTPPPVPVVVPGRQGQIQSPTDDKLLAAIANLEKTFQASAGGGPITLQTTIQNNVNPASATDIKSMEQSQINAQYRLVEELERRRRK